MAEEVYHYKYWEEGVDGYQCRSALLCVLYITAILWGKDRLAMSKNFIQQQITRTGDTERQFAHTLINTIYKASGIKPIIKGAPWFSQKKTQTAIEYSPRD